MMNLPRSFKNNLLLLILGFSFVPAILDFICLHRIPVPQDWFHFICWFCIIILHLGWNDSFVKNEVTTASLVLLYSFILGGQLLPIFTQSYELIPAEKIWVIMAIFGILIDQLPNESEMEELRQV